MLSINQTDVQFEMQIDKMSGFPEHIIFVNGVSKIFSTRQKLPA